MNWSGERATPCRRAACPRGRRRAEWPAAILTEAGNVYVGVCIDTACSMGFCAEHAAAAAMITAGEQHIEKLVAVGRDGRILPPCGRCREFLSQLDENNADARVLVREGTELLLRDLLPYDWKQFKDET